MAVLAVEQFVEIYRDGDDSNKWDPADTSELRIPSQITPRHLKGAACGVKKVMFDQQISDQMYCNNFRL